VAVPIDFAVSLALNASGDISESNVSRSVRRIHKLSSLKISSLKQPGRYSDGAGLELQVSPLAERNPACLRLRGPGFFYVCKVQEASRRT